MNWKQALRDKSITLICGTISVLLNIWYYSSLMEIINRFDLEEKINRKRGFVPNGKDAFEVLKYYGYDQLVTKALIGSVLMILFGYFFMELFLQKYI